MKTTGIVLIWIGAICIAFRLHVLVGTGALIWSMAVWWQSYKERKFIRESLAPFAGLASKVSATDRAAIAHRRSMGYDK